MYVLYDTSTKDKIKRMNPIEDNTASIETLNAALTRTQDALIFGSYAAIALAIGTVLLYRRDTN